MRLNLLYSHIKLFFFFLEQFVSFAVLVLSFLQGLLKAISHLCLKLYHLAFQRLVFSGLSLEHVGKLFSFNMQGTIFFFDFSNFLG